MVPEGKFGLIFVEVFADVLHLLVGCQLRLLDDVLLVVFELLLRSPQLHPQPLLILIRLSGLLVSGLQGGLQLRLAGILLPEPQGLVRLFLPNPLDLDVLLLQPVVQHHDPLSIFILEHLQFLVRALQRVFLEFEVVDLYLVHSRLLLQCPDLLFQPLHNFAEVLLSAAGL